MSYHLTSTMIDDGELIEELKKYGEHIPTQGSKKSRPQQLTDRNREIYLKKLNHFKAREKVGTNPSKQYVKSGSKLNGPSHYEQHDENKTSDHNDDDVIELNNENDDDDADASAQYVQMANAQTSPYSSFASPSQSPGYVNLKDRIELDKTLSKYRSEINDILCQSQVKSSLPPSATKYLNESSRRTEEVDCYCPKPDPVNRSSLLDFFVPSMYRRNTKASSSSDIKVKQKANDKDDDDDVQYIGSTRPLSKNRALFETMPKSSTSNFGMTLSKLLPYLVIIIFTIIILQYLRMRYTVKQLDESLAGETSYADQFHQHENIHYCADIKDPKCSETKYILKELIDYLRYKSGKVDCSPTHAQDELTMSKTYPHMSVSAIDKCIHWTQVFDEFTLVRNMFSRRHEVEVKDAIVKALLTNPHWNIYVFNETYGETTNSSEVTYLMSSMSLKPIMCRLGELVSLIYVRGMMAVGTLFALGVSYVLFSFYAKYKTKANKSFYDLVSRVVGMVEKQYELSMLPDSQIKPYIAISHIYDSLFEPSERESKRALWNKVIKFIADHESRIHLETQFIDGEETHVWKWIVPKTDSFKYSSFTTSTMMPNSTTSDSTSNVLASHHQMTSAAKSSCIGVKSNVASVHPVNGWQGDAFSKSEKAPFSPTPCLKIRNMFDEGQIDTDPLVTAKIHNAILDKCNSTRINTTVLHVACDKKSREGCVYVKFVSNEAAGQAYQALNGTWFNGKLLNVKYLRADRYLERFPESECFTQPLTRLIF